jgi:hypothetical protein
LDIIAGQPHHFAVGVRNLPPDSLASLEQWFYRGSEFRPSLGQLRGARGEQVHLCPADDEPKILEEAADLVLNIPLDLNEQSSAEKKGFGCVTVEIFDADFLVPPTLRRPFLDARSRATQRDRRLQPYRSLTRFCVSFFLETIRRAVPNLGKSFISCCIWTALNDDR